MAWFTRDRPGRDESPEGGERHVRTEGLWLKCEHCGQVIWKKALDENLQVCPKCEHHFRIDARTRLSILFDDGQYEEFDQGLVSNDPLQFVDSKSYTQRLAQMRNGTSLRDAVISGAGNLNGKRVHICALELKFIGGSMGAVVGEIITRAIERSIEPRTPLIIVSASGGARMQEGILSLMQLTRTTIAVRRVKEAGLPYIVVLTDPTTGGVSASFAMLGDVHIAEPDAIIGFAGPRVIQDTIRQELPAGFQRSEYLLEHGMVDAVVHRHKLRETLIRLVTLLMDPLVVEGRSLAVAGR
jgi:acetyl-CoA carboxylase carboxyl transferase subunit beta